VAVDRTPETLCTAHKTISATGKLTPWSTVQLEKLTVAQQAKKCFAFYRNRSLSATVTCSYTSNGPQRHGHAERCTCSSVWLDSKLFQAFKLPVIHFQIKITIA
jgi:hypothetical protein